MKHLVKIALLILVVGWTNCLTAQSALDKKTLVTIGSEPVTVAEFTKVYQKNNAITDTTYRESVKEYLDLFINFKLKVMEAEAMKMDTNAAFIKELDGYRTQLAKPYFIDESVNDALLQEAYDRMVKDVRASHILIMVGENATPEDTLAAYNKILSIREEVVTGKKTFTDAAMEYSDDQSARDREAVQGQSNFKPGNQGDLGYFTVFNMVYPFESAAYNTAVNEVSPPTRSRYGYHLVKVTDKRDAMGIAEVAHIFVAVRPEATEEDLARKTEKINNIYQKLQEGITFEAAVAEYSEDKGSVQNQGKLSKFTSSRVVPQFVLVVDSLKVGEVAAPIRTLYGWHIIKLISRETPGTLEKETAQLKERLAKDQRSQKSEEAVISAIKKNNKFKAYPKAKDEVIALMDSTVLQKTFYSKGFIAMTKPIMKLGKQVYSQADFALFVEKNQKPTENTNKNVYLNQLYNQFVNDNCLSYMDSRLEAMYPDFKDLMNEYHDGILLFNLTDEEVWSKAVKDTTGMQAFFEQHRQDYRFGERVDATIYKIRNKKDADRVALLLAEVDNDGDLAKALDRDSIKSVRMSPGKYEKGSDTYVDAVAWTPGVAGPITSDVEELVVFIKIREILPEQPKELNEARGLVTADYQSYLEATWLKQLKEKYPVVINKEVMQQLLNQNQ